MSRVKRQEGAAATTPRDEIILTQEAKGDFSIRVLGDWHCGPDHTSPKRFPYEVRICYPASAVDSRGFLLDNTYFQQYFDDLEATDLSCELLVHATIEHFRRTGAGCVSVEVAISPIPGKVCLRASWPPATRKEGTAQ